MDQTDEVDLAREDRLHTLLVLCFACAALLASVAVVAAAVGLCCARQVARCLYDRWRAVEDEEGTEVDPAAP